MRQGSHLDHYNEVVHVTETWPWDRAHI